MNKRSKALLLTIFIYLSLSVQCHELLIDFLDFQDQNLQIQLTKTCADHLRILRNGIRESKVWALKGKRKEKLWKVKKIKVGVSVQDASGRSTSGILWGNNFQLGGERACHLLNDPPKINIIKSAHRRMHENVTDIASEIPVEYRMFYASHTSKLQFDPDLFNKSIIHVGLCFPKKCNNLEASYMADQIFADHFKNSSLFGDVKYLGTKTLDIRNNFLHEPFVVLLLWVGNMRNWLRHFNVTFFM